MRIEITLEMIEAGAIALASFDSEFNSFEEGAKNILRAMLRAKASKVPVS